MTGYILKLDGKYHTGKPYVRYGKIGDSLHNGYYIDWMKNLEAATVFPTEEEARYWLPGSTWASKYTVRPLN